MWESRNLALVALSRGSSSEVPSDLDLHAVRAVGLRDQRQRRDHARGPLLLAVALGAGRSSPRQQASAKVVEF